MLSEDRAEVGRLRAAVATLRDVLGEAVTRASWLAAAEADEIDRWRDGDEFRGYEDRLQAAHVAAAEPRPAEAAR